MGTLELPMNLCWISVNNYFLIFLINWTSTGNYSNLNIKWKMWKCETFTWWEVSRSYTNMIAPLFLFLYSAIKPPLKNVTHILSRTYDIEWLNGPFASHNTQTFALNSLIPSLFRCSCLTNKLNERSLGSKSSIHFSKLAQRGQGFIFLLYCLKR